MELPFQDADQAISMFIYLPYENTPTAVDDVLEKFTAETFDKLNDGMNGQVDVELPKIVLKGEYVLSNVIFCFFFLECCKLERNTNLILIEI